MMVRAQRGRGSNRICGIRRRLRTPSTLASAAKSGLAAEANWDSRAGCSREEPAADGSARDPMSVRSVAILSVVSPKKDAQHRPDLAPAKYFPEETSLAGRGPVLDATQEGGVAREQLELGE